MDTLRVVYQGIHSNSSGELLASDLIAQASYLFEKALADDPSNVDALVGSAYADFAHAMVSLPDDRAALHARAEATLKKVLSFAPEHALAHWALGRVYTYTNRMNQGIAECERALLLNRNLASAHVTIGLAKSFNGRADETDAHVNDALHLSPFDINAYLWTAMTGYAKLLTGNDEEAIVLLRRVIETNRNFPRAHFYLGAALAHLGRTEEAQGAIQEGRALDPGFTVAHHMDFSLSDNPVYLAQRERVLDGMRKAGLPEG